MLSKRLLSLVAVFMCAAAVFSAQAQNQTVTGIVADDLGPIAGAVVLCGDANAITDIDGVYTINVPSNGELEFSCLGYKTLKVPVNGRAKIDVTLTVDAVMLESAVVLGYGVQTKKKDLSASVGIVENMEKIAERPSTDITNALQGQIPGVTISNNGGDPTSEANIVIRGQGSRNGDQVLWVVDGVPGQPIVSMNEVESIVVLKDAASAAIYGATSGAGGVILVTTKKARQGVHLEYNLVAGFRQAAKLPQTLTAQQEIDMKTTSYANAGITLPDGWDPEKNPWIATQRTDWMKEIFRNAFYQRHDVTFNYGSEKVKTRLTLALDDNNGLLINTYKKTYSVGFNGQYDVNKWLQFTARINYDEKQSRGTNTSSAYTGALISAIYMPPSAEAYATAGPNKGSFGGTTTEDPAYIAKYGNYAGIFGDAVSPLRILRGDNLWNRRGEFTTNVGVNITPIKGLKLSSNILLAEYWNIYKNFYPKRTEVGKPIASNSLSEGGAREFSWRSESTISFDRTFGKHTVGALLAMTFDKSTYRGVGVSVSDFLNESQYLQYVKFGQGTVVGSDSFTMDGNIAFVARASYSYDDRYFVTASWRRDYAGRLPKGHNFGDFPAVTGAWKISSEPFFPKIDALTLFKVRGSWGRIGNLGSVAIGYKDASLNSANSKNGAQYGVENRTIWGYMYYPSQVVNQNLTWETSEQWDIGLDMAFAKDRLSFSADYYNKRTYNLIQEQTMGWPATIGLNPMLVNQGEISNQGVELSLSWADRAGKDFNYYINANYAYNKNSVISTGVKDDQGNAGVWTGGGEFRNMPWIYQSEAGQPLNSFYMIPCLGIFQSEEDVYDHQKDGKLIQPNARPGDLKFQDTNNDGKIDSNDRVYCGSGVPQHTFALSGGINWKGLTVDLMFQGVAGNKIAYVAKQMLLNDTEGGFSRCAYILNAWSPTNPSSNIPILSASDPNSNFSTPSTWYLEDGSYLRLKNLTIGYDFTSLLNRVPHFAERASTCRIYVSMDNLFTITKYSGMDPEVGGFDTLTYPLSRSFVIGLKINY